MGLTVVTSAGNINVTTARDVLSSAPSGWDEQVAEYGMGYNYPPSSPTSVYRIGDDADIEAAIFAPVRVANSLKVQNSLVSHLVLGNPNFFGNTNRFTDIDGLQVYGNDYIIDHYTGLGWIGTSRVAAIWNIAIDTALLDTDAGFTDWVMASLSQVFSIIDFSVIDPRLLFAGQPSMFNIGPSEYFVSTSGLTSTSNAYRLNAYNTALNAAPKTGAKLYSICRKHF